MNLNLKALEMLENLYHNTINLKDNFYTGALGAFAFGSVMSKIIFKKNCINSYQ
jgi:hypothetical protein